MDQDKIDLAIITDFENLLLGLPDNTIIELAKSCIDILNYRKDCRMKGEGWKVDR